MAVIGGIGGYFIPSYWGWTEYTPVIPKLYWDVYSQEERIKRLCMEYDKIIHYASMVADETNKLGDAVAELEQLFEQFKESGFDDYYKQQLDAWLDAHMQAVIDALYYKMVWFGLTEDGYFTAYMVDKFAGITFDTGMVYGSEDYGRLILRTNVTSYVNNMKIGEM